MKKRTGRRGSVVIPERLRPLLERIGRLAESQGLRAYAVGGCVRDWLLRIDWTTDLDVTVEGSGLALAREVAREFGAPVTAHEVFRTATVLIPWPAASRQQPAARKAASSRLGAGVTLRVDFATCRKETYVKPAAYPRVTEGTLADDLFRRDFTINAMAVAITPASFGTLIDPFHGAADLEGKRLRILHARSFLDDPSRILRGERFILRFGFHWEGASARSRREAVASGVLSRLNAGRIRKELERAGQEPDPDRCVQRLKMLLSGVVPSS